jgi:hypothetical protein
MHQAGANSEDSISAIEPINTSSSNPDVSTSPNPMALVQQPGQERDEDRSGADFCLQNTTSSSK